MTMAIRMWVGAMALCLLTGAAQADLLLDYAFDTNRAPTFSHSAVSGSLATAVTLDLSVGNAGQGALEARGSFRNYDSAPAGGSGAPVWKLEFVSGGTEDGATLAEGGDGYVQVTITAQPDGPGVRLETFQFFVQTNVAGSTPYAVYTDADDYASALQTGNSPQGILYNSATGTPGTATAPVVVDLTSLAGMELLPGQTRTFQVLVEEFRNASVCFDDIQVHGTVIPEPATLTLLALGGLTAMRRRNR